MGRGANDPEATWGIARPSLIFLAVMALGYAVYAADRTVLSSMLKPLSAALGLGSFGVAWLAAAQYIGVFAFVFLSGYLADRYGSRRVVLAGVVVFTLFTGLIGLSQNFLQAFVFRLVSGFGEGLFWPAAMSAVANHFGVRKGMALGVFYAGFDLGGAAGNAIGSLSYSLTSDWRTAFFFAPLLGIPVIAGIAAFRGAFLGGGGGVQRLSIGREAAGLLGGSQMSALMAFALLATWASVWQVAYLPYYFASVLRLDVATAGLLSAGVLVSGLFGKVLLGRKSDAWRRGRMLVLLSLLVVLFYGLFFSTTTGLLGPPSEAFPLGVASALAMGFFSAAVFPVMQSLAADSSGGKTGMALGLTTTFQSVATVFGTFITGALFSVGVGTAVALDAMIPAIAMVGLGLLLRDPRSDRGAGSEVRPAAAILNISGEPGSRHVHRPGREGGRAFEGEGEGRVLRRQGA